MKKHEFEVVEVRHFEAALKKIHASITPKIIQMYEDIANQLQKRNIERSLGQFYQ
ncbi:MAG: hypothetical protein ACTSU5_10615 [Promethearchaeota archaeon]